VKQSPKGKKNFSENLTNNNGKAELSNLAQ